MASLFTRRTCHELASLARLSPEDAVVDRFTAQLDEILAYLTQLRDVDVTDVPEYRPAFSDAAPLREDVATAPLSVDDVVSQAPRVHEHQIAVPKFKED